ncbi:hypothetical protein ACXR2T_06665 [Leucobacter sp. HY1910]
MSGKRGATDATATGPTNATNTARSTGTTRTRVSPRLFWLLPAGASLIMGLDAALLLLGLPAPITAARFPEVHGMLLTLGFLGTLIALERATALKRWWGYLAPALLGAGGVLLFVDALPLAAGQWVLAVGSLAFTINYLPLWRRRYDIPLIVQLLGAALATGGAALWAAGAPMSSVVPWLIGFIVLTICAERVELAAITMGERAGTVLLAHAWAIALTLALGLALPHLGAIGLGAATLSLTVWLAWHDIARRTIRTAGVSRFMAACMLAGYFWLAVAGGTLLFGAPVTQPRYDAVIHAVLLGFALSMIMAHATTILPAVLHVKLPYRPFMWLPAALLHASLIVRIWLGDGLGFVPAWQFGGALAVAALLLFVATALVSALGSAPSDPDHRLHTVPAPQSAPEPQAAPAAVPEEDQTHA